MGKQLTLNQIGYWIEGEVTVSLWGSGRGTIQMTPFKLEQETLPTKEEMLPHVNDGKFGVESIDEVCLNIYELYEHNVKIFVDEDSFEIPRDAKVKNGI